MAMRAGGNWNRRIEVICWDSTLTLLLSKNQTVVQDFKAYFKDSRDLNEYNLEVRNRVKKRIMSSIQTTVRQATIMS